MYFSSDDDIVIDKEIDDDNIDTVGNDNDNYHDFLFLECLSM